MPKYNMSNTTACLKSFRVACLFLSFIAIAGCENSLIQEQGQTDTNTVQRESGSTSEDRSDLLTSTVPVPEKDNATSLPLSDGGDEQTPPPIVAIGDITDGSTLVDPVNMGAPDPQDGTPTDPTTNIGDDIRPNPEPVNSPSGERTYHVNISGDDANSGSTRAPFKTLSHAFSVLVPGDTVHIDSTDPTDIIWYSAEYFPDGEVDKPITITGESTTTLQAIDIRADYIRVIGLNVIGPGSCAGDSAPVTGIRYLGKGGIIRGNHIEKTCQPGVDLRSLDWKNRDGNDTTDCTVENNKIVRTMKSGITITGKRHIVRNNDLSKAVQRQKVSDDTDIASLPDTDGIRFFGNDHVISGNMLHDYTYNQFNINSHIDCFQTWGPAKRVRIDGNTCIADADAYANTAIDIQSLSSLEKSKLLGAHGKGVQLSAEDDAAGRPDVVTDEITIINNIFHGIRGITTSELFNGGHITIAHNLFVMGNASSQSQNPSGAVDISNANTAVHKVYNNLIVDFARAYRVPHNSGSPSNAIDIASNLIYRRSGVPNEDTVSVADLSSMDPQLADISNQNYKPNASLPEGINLSDDGIRTYIGSNTATDVRSSYTVGPYQ